MLEQILCFCHIIYFVRLPFGYCSAFIVYAYDSDGSQLNQYIIPWDLRWLYYQGFHLWAQVIFLYLAYCDTQHAVSLSSPDLK